MDLTKGLSQKAVIRLREKFGQNILPEKEKLTWPVILFGEFKSPLIYILLGVVLISLALQEYADAILSAIVILVDVAMGFYQEYSAHKTLKALKSLVKPKTLVIREGRRKAIFVKNLVPGDLVVLGAGDKVPADGELLSETDLLVNEAILTGESEAVKKELVSVENRLFMASSIVTGKGVMRVTTIGAETKIGQIGESIAEVEKEKTTLQERLEKFTKSLVLVVLLICLLIFLIGILEKENLFEILRISVVLSIAAIPEGLPIAVTVILALGMRRILKRKGLVKKLLSLETLGSTSVICTDKTGTLTEGVMRVVESDFLDEEKALQTIVLNNEQKSNLEIALWDFAEEEGKEEVREIINSAKKTFESPFDSDKKYAQTIAQINGAEFSFVSGAPEIVLDFCRMESQEKDYNLKKIEGLAEKGLRVIGVAFKKDGDLKKLQDYSWVGILGIEDPLRKDVKESIKKAMRAGIDVKIVTGDFFLTGKKIAQNLGFELESENVMEGAELEAISEENLRSKIKKIILFARVTPHQKLKIVRVLEGMGEVVAMTGDGVNDAPALKQAHIGVVVGNASDVAKEAGDLILLNGDFKTIVAATEEGRRILANIKKVVGYVLSNSFAEIFLIFGAMLFGLPTPLTVVQILWIHLICDGPPDIMLGFEPKEENIMRIPAKEIQKQDVLSRSMKFLIFSISLAVGITTLIAFVYYYDLSENLELARTIAFASIATVSLVYIVSFKNLKKSLFATENFFKNHWLIWGQLYGFALALLAIYVPALNGFLKTVPLRFSHWLVVVSIALLAVLLIELFKYLGRSNFRFINNL